MDWKRFLIIFGLVLVLIIGVYALVTAFGSRGEQGQSPQGTTGQVTPDEGASGKYTRSDKGEGGVEVSVTYLVDDSDKELQFRIALNTHSVDLSQFSMDKLTYLRTDKGKEYKALPGWDAPAEGSHHTTGTVRFAKESNGKPVIGKDARYFEIVIRDLAGVKERVFKWNLPIK
jgi:hypothetical protein